MTVSERSRDLEASLAPPTLLFCILLNISFAMSFAALDSQSSPPLCSLRSWLLASLQSEHGRD